MSINRGRTTQGAHASLVRILSFLLFLSWWRALKRRSNHPEAVWISLEARHLKSFKKSFKETFKYVFSFIQHDRIICSWWLGVLNIRFNVFRCIRYFDQNLGSLSTLEPNIYKTRVISELAYILERMLNLTNHTHAHMHTHIYVATWHVHMPPYGGDIVQSQADDRTI